MAFPFASVVPQAAPLPPPAELPTAPAPPAATVAPRFWRPERVLLTRSAAALPHGRAMAERAVRLGATLIELPSDRLALREPALDPRAAYKRAKATLAITVASAAKRRLQPIPPSADWRFDLAEGCPAHCQYCYLAGSLGGPPITRAYANIDEILDGLPAYLGTGAITSKNEARTHEGTTFESSCYTDPLGIEHLTGSLARAVDYFGAWEAPVQLRFTTKFADVTPLLGLAPNGRVRVRLSLCPAPLLRFEGGTSPLPARLDALARLARAGYKIGLTVAPIQPYDGWEAGYDALFAAIAAALRGIPAVDVTAELITHRFTPKSKGVLQDWYPASKLDMNEAARTRKLTKFGSVKHVYPAPLMKTMRAALTASLAAHLPAAQVLYWT